MQQGSKERHTVGVYESDPSNLRYIKRQSRPRQRRPPAVHLQSRVSVQDRRNELESNLLHQRRIPHSQRMVSEERERHHRDDLHGACQPVLCIRIALRMDGISMEVRMPGFSVYPVVLADTEF
jgi:hypothetical protein